MLLFSVTVVWAVGMSIHPVFGDARISGLGQAYTAVADDSNALLLNPAGLRMLGGSDLSIRLDVDDTLNGQLFVDSSDLGLFENPILNQEFLYTSRNWGVAAFSEYHMEIEPEGSDYVLDVAKLNSLQFGVATGVGPLSIGVNIKATKIDYGNGIFIQKDEPVNMIIPFVQDVILNDYSSTFSVERVVMGVGALLNLGDFSIGAYSDEFLDFMYGVEGEINLDMVTVIETLDVGVSYQSEPYDTYGNYHPLQVLLAADIHDLGDDDIRALSLGMEINLRFLEYVQLAVRTGYQEALENWDELLFGISPQDGDYTLGMGLILPFIKVDGSVTVPAEVIAYTLDPDDVYVGDQIQAKLTFGFSL